MSDYDKAMMDCFNRAYAAALINDKSASSAAWYAEQAVKDFKAQFPNRDFRNPN